MSEQGFPILAQKHDDDDDVFLEFHLDNNTSYTMVCIYHVSMFIVSSRDALSNADDTKDIVLEAESLQTDTLQHLADSEEAYLNSSLENLAALNESAHQLDMLRDAALTDVNKQVELRDDSQAIIH